MEAFCDALCSMGYLERTEEGYRSTLLASRYLVNSSFDNKLTYIHWAFERQLTDWQNLNALLRTGPHIVENESWTADPIEGLGQRALCGRVQATVSQVSVRVDITGPRRLLDLGGGHGMYAIAFSSLNPRLESIVFDLPHIVPLAEKNIAAYEVSNVKTMAGDYTKDDIGSGYDFVFSSANSSGDVPSLIPRIREALVPGGHFIIRRGTNAAREDALMNLAVNFRNVKGGGM